MRRSALVVLSSAAVLGVLVGVALHPTFSAFTGSTAATVRVTAVADLVAPTVSSSVIQKSTGGEPSYLRPSTTYHVYANITDTGNPASGVGTVTATSGTTTAALTSGTFTAFGVSYNYRTALLTAPSSLPNGPYTYTVDVADNAANTRTTSPYPFTVDSVRPTATDVQCTNGTGTVNKPDAGDVITLTLSEPVDPQSVLAGWTGASSNIVVRLIPGVDPVNDTIAFYNATDASQLGLATIDLARRGFTAATVRFGLTGTPSTMVRTGNTVVVTLGTLSGGTTNAVTLTQSSIWKPAAALTDRAGNTISTTSVTEGGGAADRDF